MIKNAVAGVGLTIALGVGVAYAVHEVGELNAEANRIEACVDYNKQNEMPSDSCGDEPLNIALAETLRNTADTAGTLGWVAFIGVLSAGGATLDRIRRED